jgi:hypothetical protein
LAQKYKIISALIGQADQSGKFWWMLVRHWRAQLVEAKLPTEPSDRVCLWRTVRLVIVKKQYIGQTNKKQLHKQGEVRWNKVGGRGMHWAGSGIKCHVSSPTLFWRSQYWLRRSPLQTAATEQRQCLKIGRTKKEDQKRRKE